MKKWLLAILSLVIISCDANSGRYPGRESGPVYHTVSRSGETLGLISDWYTGSPNNWRTIAAANGSLDPTRLMIGDTVMIPLR